MPGSCMVYLLPFPSMHAARSHAWVGVFEGAVPPALKTIFSAERGGLAGPQRRTR